MKNLKEYRFASSPAEAVAMMRQGPGQGAYIAGGTDMLLVPQGYDFVVDINHAGLSDIARTEQGDLFLGAAVTLQNLATNPLVLDFADGAVSRVAAQCGNRPVRTTATVGGNLCNALPSADMAPVLIALDATCFIADIDSTESLPLADFFIGPRRTILDDRLLIGLAVDEAHADWRCVCHKLTRTAEDISLVQVAVALDVKGGVIHHARIVLGAVAPVPLRATLAEAPLTRMQIADVTPDIIADVAEIAAGEAEPIDDHRATAEYRRDMVRVLTQRLVSRAVAWGDGPSTCEESTIDDGDNGGVA